MSYNSADDVLRCVQDVVEFLGIDLTSVNQRGIFGNSPLAIVAGWGDVEAVKLLVAAGADVSLKVEGGDTALHRAIAFGRGDVVKLLIENGASATDHNDDGWSPRELALSQGDARIVQLVHNAAG